MKKLTNKKKILYTVVIIIALLLGFITSYLTTYQPVSEVAKPYLITSEQVNVIETKSTIVFTPVQKNYEKGLIYYPGGKVDPKSFSYAANKIAEEGYLVIIAKMPFNLAILGIDKADKIMSSYTDVTDWYLSGFSLGGTAASMYSFKNQEKIKGLILYASYTTKDASLVNASFPVLSISGSNDGLATPQDILDAKQYLPSDTTFIQIEGANHTQMALYNNSKPQDGDNSASISDIEQQNQIIDLTLEFMKQN